MNQNIINSVFHDVDMFNSILSFLRPNVKRMDWDTYKIEFQIFQMMKDLIYMWMKLEIYKIHSSYRYQSFLPMLQEHYQDRVSRPSIEYFMRKNKCEMDIHGDETIQNFFQSYFKNNDSFQILHDIFPNYETEIYPKTIQLLEFESRDRFKFKYKMRGKNYSGFQLITINQLDIYATVVGVPSKTLKKNTFQIRMNHNELYDIQILWNTVITGTRDVFFEYGWFEPPHIHPEDI